MSFGQMFIKDEAKVSSRVGDVKCNLQVVFDSNEQEFSLKGVRVRTLAVIQKELCCNNMRKTTADVTKYNTQHEETNISRLTTAQKSVHRDANEI